MHLEPDQTALTPDESSPSAPIIKSSYEANADVQRWLRDQAIEEGSQKPPFDPTFLAGQRDRPWVLSSLAHFYERDLITDVTHIVKSGKEATVYCCTAHPSTGFDHLAAKVYRPRMFRSLRNDAVYRQSRSQRDVDGNVIRSDRRSHTPTHSAKARAGQVNSWIEFEFATQQLIYDAGGDVPRPLAQMGNAVLMAYLGEPGTPAPLLREVALDRDEARPLFERILWNIELWLARDRVHGDLSAYNMLYWDGAITTIDFAQALDPRYNAGVEELLARDVARVASYFTRYGVESDPLALASDLWDRYERGML